MHEDIEEIEISLIERDPFDKTPSLLNEVMSDLTFNDTLKEIYLRMELIAVQKRGIGLAAPQVGVKQRFFLMGEPTQGFEFYGNPEIIEFSNQKVKIKEGCLSFPGLYLLISRPEEIKVKYTTISGEEKTEELGGMAARCFQHELDHLNGITFIDIVGDHKLKLANKKRNKYLVGTH